MPSLHNSNTLMTFLISSLVLYSRNESSWCAVAVLYFHVASLLSVRLPAILDVFKTMGVRLLQKKFIAVNICVGQCCALDGVAALKACTWYVFGSE